jgi:hypothetical protein
MRLNALFLAGALTALAVPQLAGAQPVQADRRAPPTVQQIPSDEGPCGPGWYWQEAGYAKHGKWRPAHCTPRTMNY